MKLQKRIKDMFDMVIDVHLVLYSDAEDVPIQELNSIVEGVPDTLLELIEESLYHKLDATLSEFLWDYIDEYLGYVKEIQEAGGYERNKRR